MPKARARHAHRKQHEAVGTLHLRINRHRIGHARQLASDATARRLGGILRPALRWRDQGENPGPPTTTPTLLACHRMSAIDGTLEGMTAWQDYQERAAYYFYFLGMDVNLDEHVIGARGEHDVDVVVRTSKAGIEQTWVVECKLWRRRVSKLHVAALANIAQDVGADRGILLSETGFQPGAIRLASFSNITLTSLTELTAECCIHRGTVVKAGPGWLACTACGSMVQPTDCEPEDLTLAGPMS